MLLDEVMEERMDYTNFMINEFAEAYKIDKPEGYRYLKKFGGLDYIREHWWALHTDNQCHVLNEIFDLCRKNGGYLR